MTIKWSGVLKTLKARGYKGDDSDLAAVESFVADQRLTLKDPAGKSLDLKALHAEGVKAAVDVSVAVDEDPTAVVTKTAEPADLAEKVAAMVDKGVAVALKKLGIDNTDPNAPKKIVDATPANWRRLSFQKAYNRKAAKTGATVFPDADMAEAWGAHLRAQVCEEWGRKNHKIGEIQSRHKADDQAILKASSAFNIVTGGSFVPDEFIPILIELRETYGKFPAACGTTPMSSDTQSHPRSSTDQTVAWTGENVTITESDPTTDQVTLTANGLKGLSRHPFELFNDSAINVGEMTMRQFARDAAKKVDQAGFSGTGTSAYGGMVGIAGAFTALGATVANRAGVVVAAGATFALVTLANLIEVVAKLPEHADTPNTRWYMHKTVYHAVVDRLGVAVGGLTYAEYAGKWIPMLRGYQVEFVQAMPKSDTTVQDMMYLGDLSQGAKYGEVRNSYSTDVSDQRYFDVDQIAIRFRNRCGILVHDVGNYHATAASREPGPIVALQSST
jgi:HK97 family phage major capsid protein